ncbi:MAG: hypothetical protein MPW15_25065 [Candidatus Manganitrophus sp.]|nr:hypothetical protein [Candidatus Manganitrophus sp.]
METSLRSSTGVPGSAADGARTSDAIVYSLIAGETAAAALLIGSVYFIHKENATFCFGDSASRDPKKRPGFPVIKDDSIGQHLGEVNKIAEIVLHAVKDKYTRIQR